MLIIPGPSVEMTECAFAEPCLSGDLPGFEVWRRAWAVFPFEQFEFCLSWACAISRLIIKTLFCFMCINYIFLGFFQISLALCFVLMFGNSMLLTSYYASSLVIIWVSVL